ncbi:MAG: ABC transporter ATP-binding protein [Actinobacteria bacterium]|nr:ABC transporter ATP-binding protein [Actinomycetota bacterium]
MTAPAVVVSDVSKSFRIYRDRQRSLKATVIKGGRARYDEFWALRDVDLEIHQGKTFGLLGNNGSGKSTLLKCMARILRPNKGSISHVGRMAAMLEVGSGFHPELSGRDNVYLNGAILGMSKAEIDRKFDSIVDFSGVSEFIDQPVKNYSSGMYVRLGFAVSIHVEPDVLLVDEVLAVGDMAFQEKCTQKFADLRREGRTVVVVSHAIDQMRTFCDEAAWLRRGQLMGVGRAQDVIDEYADQAHNTTTPEAAGAEHIKGHVGSGEVTIDRFEVLSNGHALDQVRTGDDMTIRMHFTCHAPVDKPVFGFEIEHETGFVVWGHTSTDGGFSFPTLMPGTGSVDVVIPRLPLRPGMFSINGGVAALDRTRGIEQVRRALSFSVRRGDPAETSGIAVMHSRFENLVQE